MDNLRHIVDNQVLVVALIACISAQLLKVVVELARSQTLNLKALVQSGGMPSSHSALVTALATGIGQVVGWESIEFAMATIFAVIVMYDAAGVRQAAGKQAQVINQLVAEFFTDENPFGEVKLKELLGHTPIQVLMGGILGVAVAFIAHPTA
ncbi:MAG: divergent PAP2 family protein [Cyanobacteria bacterium P01_H01_bin.130]